MQTTITFKLLTTARFWLLLLLGLFSSALQAQSATRGFDHLKTGFALTGVHASERCESCHLNGVFKGTPRDCATCHTSGSRLARANVIKPPQHVPTQLSCDSCHGTQSFVGAKFSHTGITPGTCTSCHNGSITAGKPSGHITTQASCDSCHATGAWRPAAKFDHASVTPGTCATCHNGGKATGKTASHIPTTLACDSCHRSTSAWKPTAWNHSQSAVVNQCSTCHSGAYPPADGKSANHIPYQTLSGVAIANCDSCHKSGYGAWTPAKLHSNVALTSQCASCHLSGTFGLTSKPASAIHSTVTGNCESCHSSTSSWASGAKVEHSSFTAATNCVSCHTGAAATGKSGNHIPTTSNCISCHSTSTWKPSKWNHTQQTVANTCSTCHSGAYPPADGKSANHIPYQTLSGVSIANCDTCHKAGYAAWAPAKLHSNVSLAAQCASCHLSGSYGLTSKPASAIHASVTGTCESCHKSTSSWASGAKVDHSTFTVATNCASCHNGTTATGKSGTHIPVAATNCISCHSTSSWSPTKWNHTQVSVSNTCSTCHTGGFPPADGKTANHIPYQTLSGVAIANCDSCHKSGYAAWAPAKLHSNVSLTSQCASCHLSGTYGLTSKPASAIHASVTGNCESCHKSTSSWASSAKVDHSTFTVATSCASCHNGTTATGKSGTHIPVAATNCISCHSTSSWTPTKWNHTQVTVANTCSTCHTGGFPPADGKTANHIPYQTLSGVAIANCDSCHKAGYASWNPGKLHNNVSLSNQCASCHLTGVYSLTAKPATAIHASVTGTCESCHKSTSSWTSGTKVDHSTFTVATNCASCHNGSTATGKSGTHIPVAAANCISCHSTTAWTPTKWNHTQVSVTNTCSTCHTGGFPPADGKTANHIPYQTLSGVAIANCDSCHRAGYASWNPGRLHSNVSLSNQCASCHLTGVYGLTAKPATTTHSTVTGSCETCHKSTSSWTSGVQFTHSAANAVGTGTCDGCHNGSTALGKTNAHIPVSTGTAKCDSCHKSQVSFATSVTMNHSVVTATTCKTCHNGSYTSQGATGALAKPTNHVPEVQLLNGASLDCNACHSSTSSWSTEKMNHNSSLGNGAGWCKSCHATGTAYLGNMERKALTHKAKAPTDCSMSGCHRPLGNKGNAYSKWD